MISPSFIPPFSAGLFSETPPINAPVGSFSPANGQDYGMDQIVDATLVGSEYIFLKGRNPSLRRASTLTDSAMAHSVASTSMMLAYR